MKKLNTQSLKLIAVALGSLYYIGVANAEYATTTHYVNMRTGPSIHYPPIKVVPEGTDVKVKKCYKYWCDIKYGPWTGWTNINFLQFNEQPAVIEIHEHESIWPDFFFGGHRHHHHYYYYRDERRHHRPPHEPHYTKPVPEPVPIKPLGYSPKTDPIYP